MAKHVFCSLNGKDFIILLVSRKKRSVIFDPFETFPDSDLYGTGVTRFIMNSSLREAQIW